MSKGAKNLKVGYIPDTNKIVSYRSIYVGWNLLNNLSTPFVNMGFRHWSQWKIVPIESSVLLRLSGPLFLCSTCWQPLLPDFATYIMQNINAVRGPSQFVNVPFLASQPSSKIQCPNKGPIKDNVTKCILVQTCSPNSYRTSTQKITASRLPQYVVTHQVAASSCFGTFLELGVRWPRNSQPRSLLASN